MSSRNIFQTIENDTVILPDIVANAVIEQANHLLNINLLSTRPDLMGWLTGYATAVYANNPHFRKKIQSNANKGNAGRDWLYSFMQHWLSAEILRICNLDDLPQIKHILESSGFSKGKVT